MLSRHKYLIYMMVLAVGCFFMYNVGERLFSPSSSSVSEKISESLDKDASRGDQPQIGGEFDLITSDRQRYTSAMAKGKYQLIYFGYSYCPDVCPTALSALTEVMDKLGSRAKNFQTIFITMDPKRDTPDHLASYKKNFHPRIVMLTGSEKSIKKVLKAYRVYAAEIKKNSEDQNYLMDHSSIIYLMSPDGVYLTSFTHDTPAKEILSTLKKYLG